MVYIFTWKPFPGTLAGVFQAGGESCLCLVLSSQQAQCLQLSRERRSAVCEPNTAKTCSTWM